MTVSRHKALAERLKLKNYFLIEYIAFTAVGFDLNSKENPWKYPLLTIATGSCITTLCIGMVHYSWQHIDELNMATDALAIFVQSVIAIWKCIIFVYKRKELVYVIHRVWELTEQASESDLTIIRKENIMPWRFMSTYSFMCFAAVALELMFPFMLGLTSYFTIGEYFFKGPLPATYPFEINGPFTYFLSYAWCLPGMYFVCSFTLGVDSFYSWAVHNITAQFKVLHEKIRSFSENKNRKSIERNIIDCIVYHQQTITLAEELNRAFRPIVLSEFTINSTQLCFIVYQMASDFDFSKILFLFFFMGAILVQLLLYSYGGQHLEDESEKVAIVVYESLDFRYWSTRSRKMIILLIMRAQESCKMSAIFFYVNMRLFVWVLRTSASYVTLLWSVQKN